MASGKARRHSQSALFLQETPYWQPPIIRVPLLHTCDVLAVRWCHLCPQSPGISGEVWIALFLLSLLKTGEALVKLATPMIVESCLFVCFLKQKVRVIGQLAWEMLAIWTVVSIWTVLAVAGRHYICLCLVLHLIEAGNRLAKYYKTQIFMVTSVTIFHCKDNWYQTLWMKLWKFYCFRKWAQFSEF